MGLWSQKMRKLGQKNNYLQAYLNDLVKVYLKNYNKKLDSNF